MHERAKEYLKSGDWLATPKQEKPIGRFLSLLRWHFRLWNTKRLSIDKVRGKLFENLYQKCGFKAELLNLLKCWSAFTDKFSLKCTTAIILPYVINVPRTLHCRSSERFSDRSLGPVSFQGSSVSYPVLNSCPSSVSVTWCDILKSWTLQAFAKLFLTNC